MPYKLKYTDRKATCVECKGRVGPFDWMVLKERDDQPPEGEEAAGWRIQRYCLECGLKRMRVDALELAQKIQEATNVWNLIAKRKKTKKRDVPQTEATTIPCRNCKGQATIALVHNKTMLAVCEKGCMFFV